MKKLLQLVLLCAISGSAFGQWMSILPPPPTHNFFYTPQSWYVRPDGGSRYNPGRVDGGMCDGLTDQSAVAAGAPYDPVLWQPLHAYALNAIVAITPSGHYWKVTTAGTSQGVSGSNTLFTGASPQTDGTVVWTQIDALPTNLHCAFREARFLWSDGVYSDGTPPGWLWVGTGGDTYNIEGSISDGVSYGVGFKNDPTANTDGCDANGCWGVAGNSPASGAPSPPSGSSGQHTHIYGSNHGACTALSARTQLLGMWGAGHSLTAAASSYIDFGCLDLTQNASCSGSIVGDCDGLSTVSNGFEFTNTSTNITLTDMRMHRMKSSGIYGPTGGGVVLSDVKIDGNAHGGWDADNGTTGVGSLLVQDFDISWNGCAEEYPVVSAVPYHKCTDQTHGGYGDGFGTRSADSPSPGWQVEFKRGTVSYNTQDGLDALHIAGPGSTITVSQVLAYGSMGQQLKVGGATTNAKNNILVGNSAAMCSPNSVPGAPAGYNTLLTDCGRPGGENLPVLINVSPGTTGVFQDNLIISKGTINVEIEYANLGNIGNTNLLKFDNNIMLGYFYATTGQNPTPIYSTSDLNMLTYAGSSWTHNSYFGYRTSWTCPATGESNALCVNPQLTDVTYPTYGYGNYAPLPDAPVLVSGGNPAGISLIDFNGTARGNPQTIGPCEAVGASCPGATAPPVTPPSSVSGTMTVSGTVTIQ